LGGAGQLCGDPVLQPRRRRQYGIDFTTIGTPSLAGNMYRGAGAGDDHLKKITSTSTATRRQADGLERVGKAYDDMALGTVLVGETVTFGDTTSLALYSASPAPTARGPEPPASA
jgi:hypothetical protein